MTKRSGASCSKASYVNPGLTYKFKGNLPTACINGEIFFQKSSVEQWEFSSIKFFKKTEIHKLKIWLSFKPANPANKLIQL